MVSQEVIQIYMEFDGGELVVARLKEIENKMKSLDRMFKKGMINGKVYGDMFKQLNNNMQYYQSPAKDIISSNKSIGQSLKEQIKVVQSFGNKFRMLASLMMQFGLNMLFTGMMIQKAFMNMAKTTVDTFLKISAGTTAGSQAIITLGAAFEFLKFAVGEAIGQALIPFVPLILDIVDSVVDWVTTHKELTAALVLGGIAFGTFLMLAGQFALIMSPVVSLIGMLIGGSGVGGLSAAFGGLLPIMGYVAAAMVLLYFAFKNNFGGIQQVANRMISNIIGLFFSLIENVADIIDGIYFILDGFFSGDLDKMLEGVKLVVSGLFSAIGKMSLVFLDNTLSMLSFLTKGILNTSKLILQAATSLIGILLEGFQSFFGILVDWAVDAGVALIKALGSPLEAFVKKVNSFSKAIGFGELLPSFNKIVDMAAKTTKDLYDNFTDAVDLKKASDTLNGLFDGALVSLNSLLDGVHSAVREITGLNNMEGLFQKLDENIYGVVDTLISSMQSAGFDETKLVGPANQLLQTLSTIKDQNLIGDFLSSLGIDETQITALQTQLNALMAKVPGITGTQQQGDVTVGSININVNSEATTGKELFSDLSGLTENELSYLALGVVPSNDEY